MEPAASEVGRTIFSVVRFRARNEGFLSLFTNSKRVNVRTLDENTGSTDFISGTGGSLRAMGEGLGTAGLRGSTGIFTVSFRDFLSVGSRHFSVTFLSPPCEAKVLRSTLRLIPRTVGSANMVVTRGPLSRRVLSGCNSFMLSERCHCNGVGVAAFERGSFRE